MNETTQTEEVIVTAADSIALLKVQLRALEAQELEKLPLATEEQMAKLLDCTRSIRSDVSPKDLGLNVKFRLDSVQNALLNVAKAEHEKAVNVPAVKEEAAEMVRMGHLQSFRLKMSKQGLGFKISGRVCKR